MSSSCQGKSIQLSKVPSANTNPPFLEKTIKSSKKLSKRKGAPKKKRKHSGKPCVREDNYYLSQEIIGLFIFLLKMLNNIFSKNIVWMFFIILATKGLVSQAAAIPVRKSKWGQRGNNWI